MILQALTEYYETLLAQGRLSPPGWDGAFKVSFGLELAEGGALQDLIPYTQQLQRGKKTVLGPRTMRVPAHPGRAVNISPNFLCDNSTYLLGADAKGKPERAKECFAACAALHRQLLAGVESPAARAILAFFDQWQPDAAPQHPALAASWEAITGNANLIFCYNSRPVTEDSAIADAWQAYYDAVDPDAVIGQCLVTGKTAPLARLHPFVKGVPGAQSSGAALVSFNAPAFNSFGHEQGENAPVSTYAAFAYTTALNSLLADYNHRASIGDTMVVCWSQHAQPAYQDAGMAALFGPPEGMSDQDLRSFLEKLSRGEAISWADTHLEPGEHFYFLGISPNAARLSVRFFLQDSFGNFIKNINRHYQDIEIARPVFDKLAQLPLWRLVGETVNQNSRSKAPAPQLAGDLLRAILTGAPYPATLLNGVQLRIRADREITRGRAAIIKGYYLRLARIGRPQLPEEVLQVENNSQITDIPYALGQLFSVYEQIQREANRNPDGSYRKLNTTIKDKYFIAASNTPANIFAVLSDLSMHHLRVIRRNFPRREIYFSRTLGEFSRIIGKYIPSRLNLAERSSFQLGYYFENLKYFTSKTNSNQQKEETENV